MTGGVTDGEPPGATPLDDDDLDGLLPTWVATRGELDAVEQENVEKGLRWLRTRAPTAAAHTTIGFSDGLHRRLFGDVWAWAGTHRRRATSIGVDWHQISESMQQLFDNAAWWREHEVFSPVEQAVRLHRALVWIHPYPNGNGRHTRILATSYARVLGDTDLTWGGRRDLSVAGAGRREYLHALRRADEDDFGPLLDFALS